MRAAVAAATLVLAMSGASAEEAEAPVCGTYAELAAELLSAAGEVPVARMLSDRGLIVEILASPAGETFTILFVGPGGHACIGEVGTVYSPVPTAPAGTAS
jgi:hypothetical protein